MHSSPERPPEAAASRGGQQTPSNAYFASVLATGLAAALVAALTSYAGMQGTIIGAVLGAMVGSATSQIVTTPLRAIERQLIRVGFSAGRLRRLGLLRGVLVTRGAPLKLLRAVPRRAVFGVLGIGLAGFAVGILAISLVELARGRPLSASAQTQAGGSTTIGQLARPAETEPPAAPGVPASVATFRPEPTASPAGLPAPVDAVATEQSPAIASPTVPSGAATSGLGSPAPVPAANQPLPATSIPTLAAITPPPATPALPPIPVATLPPVVAPILPTATAIVAPTSPPLPPPLPTATLPAPLPLQPSNQQTPLPSVRAD
jgi:hypothetical protein